MKKIGLLLPALLTTSCAYLSHGSMDEIMVRSYNNLDLDNITCSFKNEEGQWQAPLNFPVDIERDGNKLEIVCQNSEVIKSVEIEPKFSVGALEPEGDPPVELRRETEHGTRGQVIR